MVWTDNPTALI